jgi:ABC-2 type transport system ATP-binding protein
MAAGEVLRVSGVSKTYGRLAALDGVSFSIRSGEVLGLIGPNGAGKTTLFECLAGVLPSDSGTRLPHEQAFYLPDAIAPWPAQTVRFGLDFIVGFFGGRASLRDEVVQSLSLEPLMASRIGELSKGQRKRALLAMGLLAPQPVLLVDLKQSREVATTLRAHAASGRTLFLSIHQIADAARLCDRFILLSGGRVCGEGSLEELATAAAVRHPEIGASSRSVDLEEVFLALT